MNLRLLNVLKGETVNVDDINDYINSGRGESIASSYRIGCSVDAIGIHRACPG